MSQREKALNEIYLCPLCGRELKEEELLEDNTSPKEGSSKNGEIFLSTRKDWLCRCGEFIPQGTQISSFTGSSDRLTGEHHKRIKG